MSHLTDGLEKENLPEHRLKYKNAREFFSHEIGLTDCAFCERPEDLRLSHIIPRFVIKWFRETAATGHIRTSHDPNKRAQDGWKARMLCEDCEQLFSSWEREFAQGAFFPIHDADVRSISYGSWMAKFAAAQSWRVLKAYHLRGLSDPFTSHMLPAVERALAYWKAFLLDTRPHPGRFEQHALRFDLIADTDMPGLPVNFNRYLYRSMDLDVAANPTSAFVYSKLCRIVIIGFIEMPQPRAWKGTRISPSAGHFGSGDVAVPPGISDFLIEKAREMAEAGEKLSQRQRDLITSSVNKDARRVQSSEVFRAMQQDLAMFGRDASIPTEDES